MIEHGYTVRTARWPDDEPAIRAVREAVFVVEQRVPADLEWDGLDGACVHALAEAPDGTAIGTGRLTTDGKIGRMAVLKEHRGRGVGDAILEHLLAAASERGLRRCYLHSQVHALAFYARRGFVPRGPEFIEADIPHQEMSLEVRQ